MKKNKRAKADISREDIQSALAEYLVRGGNIKKIRVGEVDPEILKKGFSEIEDESFWHENQSQYETGLSRTHYQDTKEV